MGGSVIAFYFTKVLVSCLPFYVLFQERFSSHDVDGRFFHGFPAYRLVHKSSQGSEIASNDYGTRFLRGKHGVAFRLELPCCSTNFCLSAR